MSYIRQICKDEHREMEPWERKLDAQLDAERDAKRGRSFDEVYRKNDEEEKERNWAREASEDRDDEDEAGEDEQKRAPSDHHISRLADLVAEGNGVDRAAALRWLMHHKDGRAFARLHKGETTMKTREEHLRGLAKNYGPIGLAKHMVEKQDAYGFTEGELAEMIGQHDPRPGESAAQTFTRHYTAQTADGLALRKAIQIAKAKAMATTNYPFPR